MKLPDHVELIRSLIYKSFNNQFARLGVGASKLSDLDKIPEPLRKKREKIEVLIKTHKEETGSYEGAREKALDELTFTLFNRLAAIKVMEAHQLFPPIITKQAEHGDRSFGHKVWLERNPEMRDKELEGLREYFKYEFNTLGESIPLYHTNYPYALLPYVIDLNEIIEAFNAVEKDAQIDDDIWESDDILGWLYESYNNVKKQDHKDSGAKTEYDKVSLQSQVYTPRWVVEFLVNNSLGKLYLEMYPDSKIKTQYKIANAPTERVRKIKALHTIKLIDPASGSGNFLLYGFNFFYALYQDQIDNYGADYDEDDIPQLIIENNLHGIDLDDRAIQLAQLGLWIKAKQKVRNIGSLNFNIVSSDFYLPDFEEVQPIFKSGTTNSKQLQVIEEIWGDLQQAYKFGSLVKIEEKLSLQFHGLIAQKGTTLFGIEEVEEYERFKDEFFKNLETAVTQFASQQGNSFLTDKTKDAITFLKLVTQKYDIATANPPYTDSGDFGPELKTFIENNYKKPQKFHTNLYSSFIKRCFELTNSDGKIAMIHPLTFMYIKTFEGVRKFILDKTHINVFVDYSADSTNLFDGSFASATAFYILEKTKSSVDSLFISLEKYTRTPNEKNKKYYFLNALKDFIQNENNSHNYLINQNKLKEIKSFPFIYWISDSFRQGFKNKSVDELLKVRQGIATGNNYRCLRFWWEVDSENLSTKIGDNKKWIGYSKGGPFQRWYGNMWLVIDFDKSGYEFLRNSGNHLPSKEYYYREGITYSALGGGSFRYLPENNVFDVGGSCIFPFEYKNIEYSLAFMNSKLCFYITKCLNPTINTQVGDLKRVPFVIPKEFQERIISELSKRNIKLVKKLASYRMFERNFKNNPINKNVSNIEVKRKVSNYFDLGNHISSQILINESIINQQIFEVYNLTEVDKVMVLENEGESIGALPVSKEAKQAYLDNEIEEFPLDNIRAYIQSLPEKEFTSTERENLEKEFPSLYQSNNDLEEFCIRHQINPINVWYWFKESNVIPKQRMNDLAMEFLADLLREILMEDDDGIIPLVPNAGEKILLDRVEEKFIEKGFSMAQYSSFDSVLGRELTEYINNHFFKAFSDHLNLFMYLPKTPFIWHLTSGPQMGFDCYIIIYKWSRDKLFRIRSIYIENRERSLINRQSDLANDTSAKAQNEKEIIYLQLKEIESFKKKIDALLEEGYDPILDDGVGKNIAPLQAKDMLAYEVLNKGQLKKYLNADW
ncbi:BREX-1 system adenine-specific DNA-methyltransferase PglX [Gelidibacter gilvus]|uniref:site-specific DNA-methyltransferase (adenine-specific) n=1 Tax=Gelidibacter gilvus TaxID=59602 RepID=A0A4Q0XGH0_9FLAO|nr:BREX-1 system adenine-specific DNA-methyltransferase PglX [Gelidibacter gilvus]RXJ50434.1 BREX-1 system adenine-specific DNA-methyltransferase PglX [Gelidibacter gilvus]